MRCHASITAAGMSSNNEVSLLAVSGCVANGVDLRGRLFPAPAFHQQVVADSQAPGPV